MRIRLAAMVLANPKPTLTSLSTRALKGLKAFLRQGSPGQACSVNWKHMMYITVCHEGRVAGDSGLYNKYYYNTHLTSR